MTTSSPTKRQSVIYYHVKRGTAYIYTYNNEQKSLKKVIQKVTLSSVARLCLVTNNFMTSVVDISDTNDRNSNQPRLVIVVTKKRR